MYPSGPKTGGVAAPAIYEKVTSRVLDLGAMIGEVSVITAVTMGVLTNWLTNADIGVPKVVGIS